MKNNIVYFSLYLLKIYCIYFIPNLNKYKNFPSYHQEVQRMQNWIFYFRLFYFQLCSTCYIQEGCWCPDLPNDSPDAQVAELTQFLWLQAFLCLSDRCKKMGGKLKINCSINGMNTSCGILLSGRSGPAVILQQCLYC